MKSLFTLIVFFLLAATLRADTPFNGADLKNWKVKGPAEKNKWKVGHAGMHPDQPKQLQLSKGSGTQAMVNLAVKHGDSSDIYSNDTWGDCTIELEVMVPKGSNSGIYVMGEYELQVLDSFGKEKLGMGDMGAIYSAAPPRVNACKAPGEWQKIVIDFIAPKFDAEGKKTGNAKFVKVTLNGQVIQENAEMKQQTPGGVKGKEAAKGPIMFQGNHGPVAYRNIQVTAK